MKNLHLNKGNGTLLDHARHSLMDHWYPTRVTIEEVRKRRTQLILVHVALGLLGLLISWILTKQMDADWEKLAQESRELSFFTKDNYTNAHEL